MAAPSRLVLPVLLACAGGGALACAESDTPPAPPDAPEASAAGEVDWLALDDEALLAALADRHPPTDPETWSALPAASAARLEGRHMEEEILAGLAAEGATAEEAAGRALALAEWYSAEGVELYGPGAELAVRALEAFPESGRAWRVLGVSRARAGAPEEALACLARAARFAPDDPVPLREAGLLCYERGELELAEQHLKEALALDAGDRMTRYGLARVYEERGELALARTHLERLVDEGWEHPSPLFRLARVLAELGEDERAAAVRRRHERATILDDKLLRENAPAVRQHLAVGAWYLDHERPEHALPEYEAALALASGEDAAAALAGLADACARVGRLEEGRRHLARLRGEDPDHPLLPYLEQRLAP